MDRHDYDDWLFFMRHSIAATVIGTMAVQHVRDGRGGVMPEDMERFNEEAYAVADVWAAYMRSAPDEKEGT